MNPDRKAHGHGAARRRRRAQAGFNLIEVMVALAVLMLAVVGAAGLQSATTRANVTARNRTHAMEFLQTWVERVKLDAMAWRFTQATPNLFTGRANNAWFHLADNQLVNGAGQQVATMAADYWGQDIDQGANDATQLRHIRYCADLRGELIAPGTLRADVRVWWLREGTGAPFSGNVSVTTAEGETVTLGGQLDTDHRLRGDSCAAAAGVNLAADPRVYMITASTTLLALN